MFWFLEPQYDFHNKSITQKIADFCIIPKKPILEHTFIENTEVFTTTLFRGYYFFFGVNLILFLVLTWFPIFFTFFGLFFVFDPDIFYIFKFVDVFLDRRDTHYLLQALTSPPPLLASCFQSLLVTWRFASSNQRSGDFSLHLLVM
jgi:hypothetical protein